MAQSHYEDLRRVAADHARCAEARRATAAGLNSRPSSREIVLEPSPVRRLIARFAF
jgi:hypothetical protein